MPDDINMLGAARWWDHQLLVCILNTGWPTAWVTQVARKIWLSP